MIVAGTGHRPEFSEDEKIVRTKARVALEGSGADTFICGMAAGFDLWAGDEALLLGIEVIAARPWRGHSAGKKYAELYASVLDRASEVVNVVDQDKYPGVWVYHARDKWMVDHATHVLAYLNPATKNGGTFGTVEYARGKVPIRNIFVAPPY